MANFYGQFIGFGAGGEAVAEVFQGAAFGYSMSGRIAHPSPSSIEYGVIQKYSFTSDGNSVDVADLYETRTTCAGTQSKIYGFVSAGYPTSTNHRMIDKHQFGTTNNSTLVGHLASSSSNFGYLGAGVSGNDGYGYHVMGGEPVTNVIERFSFTSDGDASDVGDMSRSSNSHGSASDWGASYGYAAGGVAGSSPDVIDRFAFGSSSTGADVGDMAIDVDACSSHSSDTHGYTGGGYLGSIRNSIQKYAFAASSDSADIADLYLARYGVAGTSSPTHGYTHGGNDSTGVNYTTTIDSFPFASESNATEVGELLEEISYAAGTHV